MLVCVIILMMSAVAVFAGQSFDCKFDANHGRGFVPRTLEIAINEEAGTATVFDPLIAELV